MKILVIGSGAWATALSQVLLHNQHEVIIYGINDFQLNDLHHQHNTTFFGDKLLSNKYFGITNDLNIVNQEYFAYILFAVPSDKYLEVLKQVHKIINYKFHIINAAKGFASNAKDVISHLMHKDEFNKVLSYSVLLGPGFAIDVVNEQYTIINALCDDLNQAKQVASLFNCEYFNVVPSTNVVGAEITAGLKNPLAIIMGLLTGLNYSINVLAAFLTIGIQEIAQLLNAYHVNKDEILQQFCAIGDIYLTCTNAKSRNYSFGLLLAKYNSMQQASLENDKTVEGINACVIANEMFKKFNLDSILFKNILKIIHHEITPKEFVEVVTAEFNKQNKQ